MSQCYCRIHIADVKDNPSVLLTLPTQPLLGDRIQLSFTLHRSRNRRTEKLEVKGSFRVEERFIDSTERIPKVHIKVASTTVSPHWQSVKTTKARVPPPAKRKFVVE